MFQNYPKSTLLIHNCRELTMSKQPDWPNTRHTRTMAQRLATAVTPRPDLSRPAHEPPPTAPPATIAPARRCTASALWNTRQAARLVDPCRPRSCVMPQAPAGGRPMDSPLRDPTPRQRAPETRGFYRNCAGTWPLARRPRVPTARPAGVVGSPQPSPLVVSLDPPTRHYRTPLHGV